MRVHLGLEFIISNHIEEFADFCHKLWPAVLVALGIVVRVDVEQRFLQIQPVQDLHCVIYVKQRERE